MDADKVAVLVVDMINDYVASGGELASEQNKEVIPHIQDLLSLARSHNIPIYFVNSSVVSDEQPMARKWGLHAERGTWGAQVIDELDVNNGATVVRKPGYDGFYGTDLDQQLRSKGVETVVLAGIDTHVCVLQTAAGAFNHGYRVVGIRECVTTPSEEDQLFGVDYIESHFGEVVTLNGIEERLTGQWITKD